MESLRESIRLKRQALQSQPHDHPDRLTSINNLAISIRTFFNQSGDIVLLKESIELHRQVLHLQHVDHPNFTVSLNNLAASLYTLFNQNGDIAVLEESAELNRQALLRRPLGHPGRAASLSNLATSLTTLFDQKGSLVLLKQAIELHQEALSLRPLGHPDRAFSLNNLATSLHTFFDQNGNLSMLEESVSLKRQALQLRSPDHPSYAVSLSNLAVSLHALFNQKGDIILLQEAIELQKEVLQYRPPGHPSHAVSLDNLAHSFSDLFDQSGDISILKQSIELKRQALQLRPSGHPGQANSMNNLAISLHALYDQNGNITLLKEAIELYRQALLLLPSGHSNRASSLDNLACSLSDLFHRNGDVSMLKESIEMHRQALQLRPPGHPGRVDSMNNLAIALHTLFDQTGRMSLLKESIELDRQALQFRPSDHPNYAVSLDNLAHSLSILFDQNDEIGILNESIKLKRQALQLRPLGHLHRASSLNNLATSLHVLFEQRGDRSLLKESIELHRQALQLRPPGHPKRVFSLNNLAISLHTLFDKSGSMALLEELMELHHKALKLRSPGHPDHSISLFNLSLAYISLFEVFHNSDAISNALQLQRQALKEVSEDHPDRCYTYFLIARTELRDSPHFNWSTSLEHISLAILSKGISARLRLSEAIRALELIENVSLCNPEYMKSEPVLRIYTSVIQLLPRVAHFGLDKSKRLRELSGSEKLSRIAATRAVLLSQPRLAVELLEEGKGVFWQQALQTRSVEINALPLADRMRLLNLFHSLDNKGERRGENDGYARDLIDIEREIEKRRLLNEETEQFIEEIRTRPGFERFLKVPQFDQLIEAAQGGIIVVLVAVSNWAPFALIIDKNSANISTSLTFSVTSNMLQELGISVSDSNLRDPKSTSSTMMEKNNRGLGIKSSVHTVLGKIWRLFVKPVINQVGLKRTSGCGRPRLYWYPSGDFAFLPLHAAGIYNERDQARQGVTAVLRKDLKAALVAEPGPPELYIPEVKKEVQNIASLINAVNATIVNDIDSAASIGSVVRGLSEAHILHLACHGFQDRDPLQSHFLLNDGATLTISELMKLNLPNARFAFLSACETAKGDAKQPDQAVHLAASLLFCGFRSVIATMWTMHDLDGPQVTEWVYQKLLEKETFEMDDIPYALDYAIGRLREEGVPPARWATFIHMGA